VDSGSRRTPSPTTTVHPELTKLLTLGRLRSLAPAWSRPAERPPASGRRQSALILPIVLPGTRPSGPGRSNVVKGYTAKKGNQCYAVIYEGLDPVTGKEKRTWHTSGPDKSVAEKLAKRLAAEIRRSRRQDQISDLRRLPHPTMAPRQGQHTGRINLARLPPQDRTPHPPHPRQDPDPAPEGRSARQPLRQQTPAS